MQPAPCKAVSWFPTDEDSHVAGKRAVTWRSGQQLPQVTYVSRPPPDSRAILNEPDLVAFIEAHWPVNVVTTNFNVSMWDAIELMQRTDVLIGVHGAGLTNSLFMPEVRPVSLATASKLTGSHTGICWLRVIALLVSGTFHHSSRVCRLRLLFMLCEFGLLQQKSFVTLQLSTELHSPSSDHAQIPSSRNSPFRSGAGHRAADPQPIWLEAAHEAREQAALHTQPAVQHCRPGAGCAPLHVGKHKSEACLHEAVSLHLCLCCWCYTRWKLMSAHYIMCRNYSSLAMSLS